MFPKIKTLYKNFTTIIPLWAIVVVLILFIAGFLLDIKPFLVNMISSALAVILTVTVINALLLRQRRRQWMNVRSQIVSALLGHIGNIASEFMTNVHATKNYELMSFVSEVGLGYSEPRQETAVGLYGIVDLMKKYPKPDDSREQAEHVHKIIRWDIEQIRSVLIPRILAMDTDEPELVKVLSAFDNADREWNNQYIMDREISSGEQYEAAIDFMEKMADVYQYLVNNSNRV